MNVDEMTQLFLDFIDHLNTSNEQIRMDWCYTQYINHFHWNKGYLKLKKLQPQTIDFVTKCFLEVNKDLEPACTCSFPLPSLCKTQPRYDNIGKALCENTDNPEYFLEKIPNLWLHKILKFKKISEMEENLPLILQFGYIEILKRVHKHVTYDFCDNLVELFLKLKNGNCLKCGKAFDDFHAKQIPDWEYLGLTLIQFIGADNVLKLFLSRHEDIPKDELSERFYMACMFSKVQTNDLENGEVPRDRAVELASGFMGSSDTKTEFEDCLEAFLMGKMNKMFNAHGTMKKLTCISCNYCEIVLNHPVLNQVEQLDCGHIFHAICLQYIQRVCNICFCSQ
ncbi:hypothetical protein HHI36_010063 [Cryptolaemus montrouzieri]|uniref:RING-type domain-containing protein n=1 Tax=Cryptolaemus montrouzieri TaxID=559131 RepID=A0ABD2MHN1_9CUCU